MNRVREKVTTKTTKTTKTTHILRTGDAGNVLVALLDDDKVEDGDVAVNDATAGRLADTLARAAGAVALAAYKSETENNKELRAAFFFRCEGMLCNTRHPVQCELKKKNVACMVCPIP
jgi:hypothetical protein